MGADWGGWGGGVSVGYPAGGRGGGWTPEDGELDSPPDSLTRLVLWAEVSDRADQTRRPAELASRTESGWATKEHARRLGSSCWPARARKNLGIFSAGSCVPERNNAHISNRQKPVGGRAL